MYLALYRKYRPRTFDDVISQEHITTTLKNQIMTSSTGHAYLFTGSRGTGKTTCAKILAMAMNCQHPVNGNPCLECESCKLIAEDNAVDIVEMDAASNNGVDDVRQLRDEVNYTPVSCKYRVYIIDEVHMLTPQAFNALLKTLEEPPPHVKFILATTELHKVLSTIVSRCQRFEFHRVNPADSAKRLLEVADKEGVKLDENAAELIARLSDGGMRDALSILDRCIAAEDTITPEVVRGCAGVADNKHLFEFSRMVAEKDTAGCIQLLSELYRNSKDISIIVDELMGHYRDMMLYKTAPNDTDLFSVLPDELEKLARNAEMYTLEDILRCLMLLQQCADTIGKVKQRKIAAEICLVKMCTGVDAAVGAARTVTRQPKVEVVEIPEEKFVPTPPEQMSRSNLINMERTRALAREAAKTLAESQGAAQNTPPAPEPFSEPVPEPFSEPVPDEPIFDKVPEPPVFDEPPAEPEPFPEIPEENQAVSEPERSISPEPSESHHSISEKHSVSAEEWKNVVESLGPMKSALFGDSDAEFDANNVLVIRSPKQVLVDNLKDDKLEAYEKEFSDVFGYEVHIRVEKMEEAPKEEELSSVDKLLQRAHRLNIEIKLK